MYRYILPIALAFACGQLPAIQCAGQYYQLRPYFPTGVQAAMPAVFTAPMDAELSMPSVQQQSHHMMASATAHQAFQQLADRSVSNAFEGQTTGGKYISLNFVNGEEQHESVAQYDAIAPPASESVEPQMMVTEPMTATTSAACIPDCRQGALHILSYPGVLAQIDCCPDNSTGNCDRSIRRFFDYNQALRCCPDPKCLICVQEPFICEKVCFEEQEVVFFRCYQKCEPYSHARCEDQRCIQEVGQRTVKKLDPCKAKIKVPIKKIAVEYRKVWICIDCPPYNPGAEPRPRMPM